MLPLESLYYHQYEHALNVMERAIYLGTMEGCNPKEIELLSIAALFHDTGFVIQYEENEKFGAKIAENYLKTILYPEADIAKISDIILATQPGKEPKNLLEKIIKDADMDNLWREDFWDKNEKMKQELETIKRIRINDPEWHHASLDIMEGHTFYTPTEIQERKAMLNSNMEKLKQQLLEEFQHHTDAPIHEHSQEK